MDVPAGGNCLFNALVESGIIPISFLSNRTKILLKNGSSHDRQIRNYFNINEKSSIGRTIEDYIECEMSVNDKWGSKFEIIG